MPALRSASRSAANSLSRGLMPPRFAAARLIAAICGAICRSMRTYSAASRVARAQPPFCIVDRDLISTISRRSVLPFSMTFIPSTRPRFCLDSRLSEFSGVETSDTHVPPRFSGSPRRTIRASTPLFSSGASANFQYQPQFAEPFPSWAHACRITPSPCWSTWVSSCARSRRPAREPGPKRASPNTTCGPTV
jgi:hypothetical protein